jgi:hypothetical protein
VVAVAVVAAVISYRHAYELVHAHGESGTTARLMPFTVDGLIWAASMVILDASRRNQAVPTLAKWSLGVGIVATIGANVAHGLSHGAIGALISAWPALALVGSYELLMLLTRNVTNTTATDEYDMSGTAGHACAKPVRTPEQAVLVDYVASLTGPGRPASQRFLAEKHGVDRRRVRKILEGVNAVDGSADL